MKVLRLPNDLLCGILVDDRQLVTRKNSLKRPAKRTTTGVTVENQGTVVLFILNTEAASRIVAANAAPGHQRPALPCFVGLARVETPDGRPRPLPALFFHLGSRVCMCSGRSSPSRQSPGA